MVEEILPNTYKIEIPLPKNPLKALNSYLIKGQDRFLIIDTGMNRQECMHEMSSCLGRLSVDLKKTDFFITHLHVDHIGLVGDLATDTSKVYFNWLEASIVSPERSEEHLRKISAIYKSHGFARDELEKAATSHPAYLYGLKRHVDFCPLKEGDTIDIGDYSLRCIETPGHSPNHMCLYEANKKVLISGDHILSDITPNIALWPEMENPLKEYLASLEKVYPLDVDLVLPGHRNVWNDHKRRITELQEHHQARLKEILTALEDGEKTAFQIAPWVTWDIDCSSWELFPPSQKWFAVGETIAHLKYLEENRMIRRKTKEQAIVFSLT
jgi:glyoxylase-like metal-dependent hydrolase (beta-lactamase superfamily II)